MKTKGKLKTRMHEVLSSPPDVEGNVDIKNVDIIIREKNAQPIPKKMLPICYGEKQKIVKLCANLKLKHSNKVFKCWHDVDTDLYAVVKLSGKKIPRWYPLCISHGRASRKCSECNNYKSKNCLHGRQKPFCRECDGGGSQLCKCGKCFVRGFGKKCGCRKSVFDECWLYKHPPGWTEPGWIWSKPTTNSSSGSSIIKTNFKKNIKKCHGVISIVYCTNKCSSN